MDNIKAVIFDIGNTLFYININHQLYYWAQASGKSFEILQKNFVFDNTHKAFERGEISEGKFHQHINKMLDINLTYQQYFNGWNAIYRQNFPQIESVIVQLKKQVKVVALTNTNITHQKVWAWKYKQLLAPFDKVFASHEITSIKPEVKAFNTVLNFLNIPAQQCLFFDDSIININGAKRLGIVSYQVISPNQMYMDMKNAGLKISF